ncbi:MAG: uridine kinase [Legionellales bacterium]|nr:uridine kinase [Legionellales bacterium]
MSTIIIGIAGPSASGKTLLAKTIVEELNHEKISIISEDSYYKDNKNLSLEERHAINYDHPKSIEHALLREHLIALKKGLPINVPEYDYTQHIRTANTTTIAGNKIVILEGILLFVESDLRKLIDIKLFMDTPLDICLIRRLNRDIQERERTVSSVLEQYEKTVRPMYLQFIEPSKKYADLIVPQGGKNRIVIDLIKANIYKILNIRSKH